jgi:hypothetical protein
MKKTTLVIASLFLILLNSCQNNDQIKTATVSSVNTVDAQNYNNYDTIKLSSDYLFNKLNNNSEPFIFTLSFRGHDAIFDYRSKYRSNEEIFSAIYTKKGDTITLNKWDELSKSFLYYNQIPTQLLLISGGDLKVLKVNSARSNEETESGIYARRNILCNKSDIFRASTYDSMNYYTKKYSFGNNEFKYEAKCSDMDSYYLGYAYAKDQIGGGLLVDCDYLYEIAITQKANVDHTCFCKGVSNWLSDNNRTY